MANENSLLDFWRYSSMKEFLSNRYKFLQVYLLKTWHFKTSPAMLVGSAGHKALEHILKGETIDAGVQAGLDLIGNMRDTDMKWGKTGSREEVIRKFTAAIGWYLQEMPHFHKIIAVEETITQFITINGMKMAMPANGTPDVIEEDAEGNIIIHDHKFVSAYTDSEKEKADRILQALFYYHLVLAKYGRKPTKMIYHECKTSENRSGEKQLQNWILDYDVFPQYFAIFAYLYDACTRELLKEDVSFLPNISDMLDGDETFAMFVNETLGIDRPTAVKHKTEDVTLMESKYIPTSTDLAENVNLNEEEKIRLKFQEFGCAVQMQKTLVGHNVIKYTLKPPRGRRMSEFMKHEKDMAIALKAKSVRIEAPIMGTDLVGIEVPNPNRTFVQYEHDPKMEKAGMCIPIGVDVFGETVSKDITDMPHLLIAGATGSGKSVFVNVLIKALMEQNTPDSLQFLMIDPKRVELASYAGSPYLMIDPLYEVEEAEAALATLVEEMESRYDLFQREGVKNITEYRENVDEMPNIVVIIDEFADLMYSSRKSVETAIIRLAQKARAAGIHLVIATQRPSVDVVTGLIKANLPCRIAFAMSQEVDSRIVLDQSGAESLIGKGDCLFLDPSRRDLVRLQAFSL